jgi:hypothetical protein
MAMKVTGLGTITGLGPSIETCMCEAQALVDAGAAKWWGRFTLVVTNNDLYEKVRHEHREWHKLKEARR